MCGTPIGNLGDATPRLTQVLGAVHAIACEDTRRTRELLSALGVPAPRLLSYRQGNERDSAAGIVALLQEGRDIALVSDAGMPTVSDPGVPLVRAAHAAGVEVLVVPGPSAVSAAVAASGCGGGGYRFVGFLPRTARELRQLLLDSASSVVVAFESPARVVETLAVVGELQPGRTVAVARELTKRFEHTRSGDARSMAAIVAAEPPRGEIVLVLDAMEQVGAVVDARTLDLIESLVEEGVKMKVACRYVGSYAGVSARELYDAVLERRRGGVAEGEA